MNFRAILFAGAAASALLEMSPATAQAVDPADSSVTAPQAPTAETSRPATDVIIITATRREQALTDVPIAINAVTQEELQNSGTNDIRELNQLAPSLLVSSTGSEANTSARIRGIGTVGDNAGLESSVAIFVDGVYRSRTGVGMNELGEVDRVEVLRGPQGTLFGRNASAGLIHVITREPEFISRGYAYGHYGNYDYWRGEAGFTGPLSDTVAAKIEGIYETRDGYYDDETNDTDVNTRDRYLVRGQLLFEPNDALSVRLIGDYSRREEACCAAVYATDAIAPGNTALLDPANNSTVAILQAVTGTTLDQFYPSRDDSFERDIALSPGRGFEGTTEDYGASLQIEWGLGAADVTSITAYREYSNAQGADADYGGADLLFIPSEGRDGRQFETFSQEVRVQGTAFDDRLDWLVGGYYSDETLGTGSGLKFGDDYGPFSACLVAFGISAQLAQPGAPGCLSPAGQFVLGQSSPATAQGLNLLSQVRNVGDEGTRYLQNSESFAVFTHNIFALTDSLDLTLGLRWTKEDKTLDVDFDNSNTICPQVRAIPGVSPGIVTLACLGNSSFELNGITLNDDIDDDEITGTASLSWKPTEEVLVYGSFSTGYKAGGFNLDRGALGAPVAPVDPADVVNLRFDAETVDSYEIGAKFDYTGFTISANAFYSEFSSFQLNTFDGTLYIVESITGCDADLAGADRDTDPATGACPSGETSPGVTSKGVELQATMAPTSDLSISTGLTYADTRYADNLVGSADGDPLNPSLRRLPGERISNAPEFVVTNALSWTPPIGVNGLSGLVYLNARTTSDYNTGSSLGDVKIQDGYTVVNARLGVRGPEGSWAIEGWAKNLFDTDYTQVIFDSAFQGTYSAYLAEPRTYGITLRSRF